MSDPSKTISRRELLKLSAVAGAGLALGAGGFGAITALSDGVASKPASNSIQKDDLIVPFYGKHQAGIISPQQTNAYILSFDVMTNDRKEVIQLLKDWTSLSSTLSQGKVKKNEAVNDFQSPTDTGESEDLSSARLTFTFGFGPSFFMKDGKDRFGISKLKPKFLKDIPKTNGEVLQESLVGGDICVQICADNQQVAFHAMRNVIRAATGVALVRWMQQGFMNAPDGKTGRNLFGFKDGTANPTKEKSIQSIVWAESDEPAWMHEGTYMACRKIQMFLEMWDRTSLKAQEDTFGRKKDSGAAYGSIKEHDAVDTKQLPDTSHTRIAKETGQQMLRRAYSYNDGIDQVTGNIDAGLMFISFQRNPDQQFVPMLKKLSQMDMMNEYIKHIGSAMFACPGGIKKGQYIAQQLFEA